MLRSATANSLALHLVGTGGGAPPAAAPATADGADAVQLQVEDAKSSWREVSAGRTAAVEVSGLQPGRAYRLRLRAQLAREQELLPRFLSPKRGASEWCEWRFAEFTTDAARPSAPLPPALDPAQGVAGAHALPLLIDGLSANGAPLTCVRLELQSGAVGMEEVSYQAFEPPPPTATSATVVAANLAAATAYRVRARAGNARRGPWSASASFTTTAALVARMAPPATAAVGARAQPPVGAAADARRGPPAAVATYELQVAAAAELDAGRGVARALPRRGDDLRGNGALPATHYAFRVRARAAPPAAPPAAAATHRRAPQLPPSPLAGGGADGTVGEWSDAVAVRTESAPPAAPEAPALVRADSRAVALSWASVHDDGGAAVVRYELRVDASDDTTPPRGLDVPPVAAAAPNLPPPRVQARVDRLRRASRAPSACVRSRARCRAVVGARAGGHPLETPPPPRVAVVAARADGLSVRWGPPPPPPAARRARGRVRGAAGGGGGGRRARRRRRCGAATAARARASCAASPPTPSTCAACARATPPARGSGARRARAHGSSAAGRRRRRSSWRRRRRR